jgi:hypothetical protein
MNTRETFYAIRRAYRIAHNVPFLAKGGALNDGALENRIATTSALRSFTGKWDTCQYLPMRYGNWADIKRTQTNREVVYAPVVYAACTRFLRTH